MKLLTFPDNQSLEQDFQRRADFDYIKRALPGVFLYLAAWPIIFVWTGFHAKNPFESSIFGVLLISVCLLRLVHGKLTHLFYDEYRTQWNLSLILLSLIHAATWGALFYLVNQDPRFDALSVIVNLVTAGVASASMISLIPKYHVANWYVSFLLLPTAIASAFTPEIWQMGLIVFLYWMYLMIIGRRFHREYARAFHIEKELFEKQQELEVINRTDALTGAYNRRYFDQQFTAQWQETLAQGQSFTLMLLDIDHFKKLNDQYGHPTGDQCLIHFVKKVAQATAEFPDTLFRYGGEEFAIIIKDQDRQALELLAEATRDNLDSNPAMVDSKKIPMTTSIGCCYVMPNQFLSPTTLLELTDKALYQAKERGRNKVVWIDYVQDQLN